MVEVWILFHVGLSNLLLMDDFGEQSRRVWWISVVCDVRSTLPNVIGILGAVKVGSELI